LRLAYLETEIHSRLLKGDVLTSCSNLLYPPQNSTAH